MFWLTQEKLSGSYFCFSLVAQPGDVPGLEVIPTPGHEARVEVACDGTSMTRGIGFLTLTSHLLKLTRRKSMMQ